MATKDDIKALQLLLLNDNTTQDIDPKDSRDAHNLILDNQLELIQDELAKVPLTNTYIADNAITTSKHADLSVTVDKLASSSVSTAKIQAAAVQTASVKDDNITLPKLSQAVRDLLIAVGGGTITNNPDDEDLETVASTLKFKDRTASGNQKGYKIIRQDFDFTNIPAGYDNSIWEIRYEHDLAGGNFLIPANVTLLFNGGNLTNYGKITGNNTKIKASKEKILDVSGNFENFNLPEAYPEWFGSVGDGVADDTGEIDRALSLSENLILEKMHGIQSTINITTSKKIKGIINGAGLVSIAAMTRIINATSECFISDIKLDAANFAVQCFWQNGIFSKFYNVEFRDSTGECIGSTSNSKGIYRLEKCKYFDCGKGPHGYGDTNSRVEQIECESGGTTGSNGNIYYFESHGSVSILGGYFTGDSSSGPNCYKCSNVEIMGGTYENINRGATLGLETNNFAIIGTRSINNAFSGISIDLRRNDLTIPVGNGVVVGNTMKNCRYGIWCQAKQVTLSNNIVENFTDADTCFRINDDNLGDTKANVFGNVVYGAGSKKVFKTGSDCEVNYSHNITDSTSSLDIVGSDITSKASFGKVVETSADLDVSLNTDIVLVDGSSGGVDLRFPANNFSNSSGKRWKIIRIDNDTVNSISIRVKNDLGKINGGSSFTIPPSSQYEQYEVVSTYGGNYFVK